MRANPLMIPFIPLYLRYLQRLIIPELRSFLNQVLLLKRAEGKGKTHLVDPSSDIGKLNPTPVIRVHGRNDMKHQDEVTAVDCGFTPRLPVTSRLYPLPDEILLNIVRFWKSDRDSQLELAGLAEYALVIPVTSTKDATHSCSSQS